MKKPLHATTRQGLSERCGFGKARVGRFDGGRRKRGGQVQDDGSLLDFHYAEVRSREAIRRNCRSAILVADRSKFGRSAPAIGGNLLDADRVIIDALPAAAFRALMGRAGERLEVTGIEST